ncbi:MAG: AAA family ATPase [Candidatus Caccosoma sp.]|nr:AAA family ATPase [Candidatus Caccosoma sp.]
MFKRKIEKTLMNYYNNSNDKIIIIDGARQIGKSYIIRNTASKYFNNYVEIDLKSDYEVEKLFENVKTTKAFYLLVGSLYGNKLNTLEDTIIFLDEIQFYPHLITMLKDLKKEAKYRYIASGSLLGVTLKHSFIPMGSIDKIKMYPMDFEEFLWANNVSNESIDYLRNCFEKRSKIEDAIHQTFLSLFKDYLICGGLPDAVTEYVLNRNVIKTRNVHTQTFTYYKDDCSKYDIDHKLKISKLYDLMISNMVNKVKRIIFKKIENKEDTNLEKYEEEFDYLCASGVANSAHAVSNPIFPLNESTSKNLVKLYYNDVGILTNLLYRNNISAILGSTDKGINLGSVYETVCAMELKAHGHELYYFDSKKVGEVDFLINDYNNLCVLPIEIKSGKDQNNFRAIPKLVSKDGNYKLPYGYVFGNKNIVEEKDGLITLPIYLIMFV